MSETPAGGARCPVCGRGELVDIADDLATASREPVQQADSRELVSYSCGHQVAGGTLAAADEDVLAVERRTSDETVDPGPAG
jgi:hypothetical protein